VDRPGLYRWLEGMITARSGDSLSSLVAKNQYYRKKPGSKDSTDPLCNHIASVSDVYDAYLTIYDFRLPCCSPILLLASAKA
jgi:hypothetical protein